MNPWDLIFGPLLELALIVLAVVTVAMGLGAIVAYLLIKDMVGDGATRSRILRREVVLNRRTAFAGGLIAVISGYSLLRLTILPDLWSPPPPTMTIVLAIAIDMLLWGPFEALRNFRRMRQQGYPSDDGEQGADER